MRLAKWIFVVTCVVSSFDVGAALSEEASQLAAEFAEAVLRDAYGLQEISLTLRTGEFKPAEEPERFWITVSKSSGPCAGPHATEVGEIYIQFVKGQLHSLQWLPSLTPSRRAPMETRTQVLAWARKHWDMAEQVSEKSVPSSIPTQHLEFSRRRGGMITLILDSQYGFLHRAYLSRPAAD